MDNFWQVIERRHCQRSFNPQKKISQRTQKKLIAAGHKNPTAGGLHPERFIWVEKKNIKERLAAAAHGQTFLAQAPVVLIICADLVVAASKYGQRGKNLYAVQDTAAAAQNILLAATALGLAACWVGGFSEKEVKEILRLKAAWRPLVLIPLGYHD